VSLQPVIPHFGIIGLFEYKAIPQGRGSQNNTRPMMVGFLLGVEPIMMSDMEKNAQIGELVKLKQEQKLP